MRTRLSCACACVDSVGRCLTGGASPATVAVGGTTGAVAVAGAARAAGAGDAARDLDGVGLTEALALADDEDTTADAPRRNAIMSDAVKARARARVDG